MITACSKSGNNTANSNNNSSTVYMKGSVFSSSNLQVVAGSKVTWKNDDSEVHTVTADDNSFDSGDIQPGGSFNYSFNSMGTFGYHCKHHAGMTGSVVVINTGGGHY
jgi:plastocyanin